MPYASGTLKAEGLRGDRVVAESVLETTGVPVRLKLTADRTSLSADGQDLAFVNVEAVDEKGRLQMMSDQKVHFAVNGAATIAAVDNGDGKSQDSYAGDSFNLFNGRALVVLRTSRKAGQIRLQATADGLIAASVVVESRPSGASTELRLSIR